MFSRLPRKIKCKVYINTITSNLRKYSILIYSILYIVYKHGLTALCKTKTLLRIKYKLKPEAHIMQCIVGEKLKLEDNKEGSSSAYYK